MTPLLWAFALLLLAVGIVAIEMFIPSGGLLAVCAITALLVAVGIVFTYEGPIVGSIFFVVSCVVAGGTLAGVIKWWPYTAIGRRVLNLPPGQEQEITSAPDYQPLQALVGQHGLSVSKMVPGGVINLLGESYDAVSQAGVIEEGTPVTVISVDGTRIMVRKADDAAIASMSDTLDGENDATDADDEPVETQPSEFAIDDAVENADKPTETQPEPKESEKDDGPRVIPNPFEDPLV